MGGESLPQDQIEKNLEEVPNWKLSEKMIGREFEFKDFKEAMIFVNNVADLAETEGHHPDITIHWNKVKLDLWTHSVDGLTDNDFIVASKINKLNSE